MRQHQTKFKVGDLVRVKGLKRIVRVSHAYLDPSDETIYYRVQHLDGTHQTTFSGKSLVKVRKLSGWRKSGVCPSCGMRSISAGECKRCGWKGR